MYLKNSLIIFICKVFLATVKIFSLGSGSTWPGHIALKMNTMIIKELWEKSHLKVILIAGTNGKTTTSTLLKFLLEKNRYKVFQNEEGANLLNGVASCLVRYADINGKLPYDYGIFEIDENTLPQMLEQIQPTAIILLNLFRDQLDRYGEVNTVGRNWKEALRKLPENVNLFVNGDDPQIYYLGLDIKSNVYSFGLHSTLLEKKEVPHDVDSTYCPNCGEKLSYKTMSYSHLGDFSCSKCSFKRENIFSYLPAELKSSLTGVYNLYNISAVFLLLEKLLNIHVDSLSKQLLDFEPAFGRQEIIQYQGRNAFLLLSKNPTGFNQSIEAINSFSNGKINVLLILNDRIPDGRDISWIWDVEFENLLNNAVNVVVTGDRTFDMALRLKYSLEKDAETRTDGNSICFDRVTAIQNLESALALVVKNTPKDETLYILATYSGMLDVRKLLIGKKIR